MLLAVAYAVDDIVLAVEFATHLRVVGFIYFCHDFDEKVYIYYVYI